jgi:hypothetical protein
LYHVINETIKALNHRLFVGEIFCELEKALDYVNPFQSRDAIWHHTFNSVLHMLQFSEAGKGTLFSPKKL